jgi:hypothetical protein
MATIQQRVSAVTNYTLEYFQRWRRATAWEFEVAAAQLLLAAGRGPARVHTCEQTLHHICFVADKEDFVASAPLPRAVALLRAGELRTLRVTHPTILAFILSALAQRESAGDVVEVSQVFAPLRVVEWAGLTNSPEATFVLLERYAASIRELNCRLLTRCDAADKLLPRCIELESLTFARYYAPSAWLQLSQLHTLRGVDLHDVSMAAIAAALPRLHTLIVFAFESRVPSASVAGFFDDLLPRLQVFQYIGQWPQDLDSDDASPSCPPLPLPNLRTLKLQGFGDHPPPWAWFMGAQPQELCTDDVMIRRWLPPHEDDAAAAVVFCPLASVRTLHVYAGSPILFTPPNAQRLVRAAPHLETLTVAASGVNFDSWRSAHAAFDDGLVHSKLKHIRVSGLGSSTSLPSDLFARLRQRHFPRLRRMVIFEREYFITPLESPSFVRQVAQFASRLVSQLWERRG